MANSRTDENMLSDDGVPPGWKIVCEVKKNGKIVKYYTNILGQKFYNKPDLIRNIEDSKKRGLSIYAPDFRPPPPGRRRFSRKLNDAAAKADAAARNKKAHHASRNYEMYINSDCKSEASSTNEVVNHNDFECASALIDLSLEREDAIRRARNLLPIAGSTACITDACLKHAGASWMEQVEPSRTSRRLVGLEPELKHHFISNKPLEYVLISPLDNLLKPENDLYI